MAGLDHHAHALGLDRVLNGVGDLPGEPLAWICKHQAKTSTNRGILLRPITLPLGTSATCTLPKKGSM